MTKKKILVVDDEIIGRQLLQALLIVEGFEPILATNGDEALELAKENTPDLILLDVMMPRKNGFETMTDLKHHARLKQVPVILVSALDDRNTIAKGYELGASGYISKPYESKDVIKKIKDILSSDSNID
jgi:DNA-binding response OmpR family regulator